MKLEKVSDIVCFGGGAVLLITMLIGMICASLNIGSDALRITLLLIVILSAGVGGIGGLVLEVYGWYIRKRKASA